MLNCPLSHSHYLLYACKNSSHSPSMDCTHMYTHMYTHIYPTRGSFYLLYLPHWLLLPLHNTNIPPPKKDKHYARKYTTVRKCGTRPTTLRTLERWKKWSGHGHPSHCIFYGPNVIIIVQQELKLCIMCSLVQQELKLCTCVVFCSAGIEVVYMCRLLFSRICTACRMYCGKSLLKCSFLQCTHDQDNCNPSWALSGCIFSAVFITQLAYLDT